MGPAGASDPGVQADTGAGLGAQVLEAAMAARISPKLPTMAIATSRFVAWAIKPMTG
jgi:hypothetical protein